MKNSTSPSTETVSVKEPLVINTENKNADLIETGEGYKLQGASPLAEYPLPSKDLLRKSVLG